MLDEIYAISASTLRTATPLLFAALGGIASERSGVVNICLEGFMLLGAFVAASVALATGSPWLAFAAGGAAGICLSALYATCTVQYKANQIVAGTGINMLALGITPIACKALYDTSGSTPALPLEARFTIAPSIIVWGALAVFAVYLSRTVSGLRLSFAGEKPQALEAAGVSINAIRWKALLLSGFLAGLGGATLSIYLSSSFARNMTAGRGFMALAALILGNWKPQGAAFGCLIFAFFETIQFRMQGIIIWGDEPLPVQFIQILPYIVTIVILAGFIGRARPPSALGTN